MKQNRLTILGMAAVKLVVTGILVVVVAVFAQAGAAHENAQRQLMAAAVATDQLTDNGQAYQALKASGIDNNLWATVLGWVPALAALLGLGYAAWVVAGTVRTLKLGKKKEKS